jgi:Protein of unknown function (DUF2949)
MRDLGDKCVNPVFLTLYCEGEKNFASSSFPHFSLLALKRCCLNLAYSSISSLLTKEVPMKYGNYLQFIHFLQEDLAIPARAIAFAERIRKRIPPYEKNQSSHLLSMILWQYGLMNIEQLNRSFVWLEEA